MLLQNQWYVMSDFKMRWKIFILSLFVVRNLWNCFILISWLVVGNIDDGWLYLAKKTIPVWKDFPRGRYLLSRFSRVIFYLFLARFTSLKIKVVVVCLSLAANVVRFGNVNADEFISRQFVLSLSGTVFLQCCLVKYRTRNENKHLDWILS